MEVDGDSKDVYPVKSLDLVSDQVELALEDEHLEKVNTFGHPPGLVVYSRTIVPGISFAMTIEKDQSKDQELLVIVSWVTNFKLFHEVNDLLFFIATHS